jgi:predicted RNA-binding Zn-ribbon protein involved in translation (DUF1610 family)
MSSITPTIPNPITDGQVTGDLICVECEYNLRTLAISAACPECGMDVIVSARRDRLAAAPKQWLNSIARGAWLLRMGVIFAMPFVYPGILVSCLGLWLLTRAQPGRVEPALDRGFRLATRWAGVLGGAVIVCLASGAVIALLSGRQRLFEDWRYNDLPIFDILILAGHFVWAVGLLSAWRYLRVLAERVPDSGLAASFHRLGRHWLRAVLVIVALNGVTFGLTQVGLLTGGGLLHLGSHLPDLFVLTMAILLWLWGATLRVVNRQDAVLRALANDS